MQFETNHECNIPKTHQNKSCDKVVLSLSSTQTLNPNSQNLSRTTRHPSSIHVPSLSHPTRRVVTGRRESRPLFFHLSFFLFSFFPHPPSFLSSFSSLLLPRRACPEPPPASRSPCPASSPRARCSAARHRVLRPRRPLSQPARARRPGAPCARRTEQGRTRHAVAARPAPARPSPCTVRTRTAPAARAQPCQANSPRARIATAFPARACTACHSARRAVRRQDGRAQ